MWGGRPRPPLLKLVLFLSFDVFLSTAQFEYGKSKSKAAGEGARTTHNHTRPMILFPRLYAILDMRPLLGY